MAEDANQPEKKIYVDEDWKTQVEREKEAASQASEGPSGAAGAAGDSGPALPADLLFLIGSLQMQGIIAMGLVPNPATNKVEPSRMHARYVIDLLSMLQQKTEGNRTPEESEELETVLHQLRLAFVTIAEQESEPPKS